MSAAALESALAALGIDCAVEGRESLAVLVPRGDAGSLADPAVRRRVAGVAREHGFTHVALELLDAGVEEAGRGDGAALPRA